MGTDDPQDLRILDFDIQTHRFSSDVRHVRLEMPGAKVNLTSLTLVGGAAAYPGATAPTGTGGESAAELTAVNAHQFLLLERDGNGDGVPRRASRRSSWSTPATPGTTATSASSCSST